MINSDYRGNKNINKIMKIFQNIENIQNEY